MTNSDDLLTNSGGNLPDSDEIGSNSPGLVPISGEIDEEKRLLHEADLLLSEDQLNWCEDYLRHGDSVRAARKHFPENTNPARVGRDLLKDDHILAYIKARVRERALATDMVLAQYAEIATSSIEDFITFDEGSSVPRFDLRKARELGKLHLIKRIRYVDKGPGSRGAGIEVELYSRMQALEMIGRHLGMWRESEEKVGEFVIRVVRE